MLDVNVYVNATENSPAGARAKAVIKTITKDDICVLDNLALREEIIGLKNKRQQIDYDAVLEKYSQTTTNQTPLTERVKRLTDAYRNFGFDPIDAFILAFAVEGETDFFVTDNRRTIINRKEALKELENYNRQNGLKTPTILTSKGFLLTYRARKDLQPHTS